MSKKTDQKQATTKRGRRGEEKESFLGGGGRCGGTLISP